MMSDTGRGGSDGGMCAKLLLGFAVTDAQSILIASHSQVEKGEGTDISWTLLYVTCWVGIWRYKDKTMSPGP